MTGTVDMAPQSISRRDGFAASPYSTSRQSPFSAGSISTENAAPARAGERFGRAGRSGCGAGAGAAAIEAVDRVTEAGRMRLAADGLGRT